MLQRIYIQEDGQGISVPATLPLLIVLILQPLDVILRFWRENLLICIMADVIRKVIVLLNLIVILNLAEGLFCKDKVGLHAQEWLSCMVRNSKVQLKK